MWGVFGLCLLLVAAWGVWRARHTRRMQHQFVVDDADSDEETTPSRLAAFLTHVWNKRWVRRLVLLLRLGYLLADVGLDIWVVVWLFRDGDVSSAGVCLAFLLLTQAAVAVAVLVSLFGHFFSSKAFALAVSPLLVPFMPVVAPVLAVANIRNPDVPLVFWR